MAVVDVGAASVTIVCALVFLVLPSRAVDQSANTDVIVPRGRATAQVRATMPTCCGGNRWYSLVEACLISWGLLRCMLLVALGVLSTGIRDATGDDSQRRDFVSRARPYVEAASIGVGLLGLLVGRRVLRSVTVVSIFLTGVAFAAVAAGSELDGIARDATTATGVNFDAPALKTVLRCTLLALLAVAVVVARRLYVAAASTESGGATAVVADGVPSLVALFGGAWMVAVGSSKFILSWARTVQWLFFGTALGIAVYTLYLFVFLRHCVRSALRRCPPCCIIAPMLADAHLFASRGESLSA